MRDERIIVGLVSLTDTPRAAALVEEREQFIASKHMELVDFLEKQGFRVVNAAKDIPKLGSNIVSICTPGEVAKAVDVMKAEHTECVIIGAWHWTEPMLGVQIAREMNKPLLLYAEDDPAWAAPCFIGATGASLWQVAPNSHSLTHERIVGDKDTVVRWVRGVGSLEKLKKSTFVLWGGSYALRMEYLNDDFSRLKSFLVDDILVEDQYLLIRAAENVSGERLDDFIGWLESNGTKFRFDGQMLTPEVLRKQAALYLGARDRLNELKDFNISGASVKCFSELSDIYGIDPCFLPAFMPFPEDSEGKREIIPMVCEGDIKMLITNRLLQNIVPGVPAQWGDVSYVGRDYFVISNCGASSIYYAGLSGDPKKSLPKVIIAPNCEGCAGGAVGYKCPPGPVTLARLIKVAGKYIMQLGLAEAIEITGEIEGRFFYGKTWPHTAVRLNVGQQLLIKVMGSNHMGAIPGDKIREVIYACREAGINVLRIDREEDILSWLKLD